MRSKNFSRQPTVANEWATAAAAVLITFLLAGVPFANARSLNKTRFLFAQPNATSPATIENAPFKIVRVFYGSDRLPTPGLRKPYYSAGRSAGLHFGWCSVSVPADRRLGSSAVEASWFDFKFHADPAKVVLLNTVIERGQDDFVRQLSDRVRGSRTREVFVFVHGYNVTFEEAIRRTATLAYDLKFGGVPITFSWPARGYVARYPSDEESAEFCVPDLEAFLMLVAQSSGATKIHLIGHSLGNRALLHAIANLSARGHPPPNVAQVVLTAPDVDRDVFVRLIDSMVAVAKRVTLYASSKDEALKASHDIHDEPRAGEGGSRVLVVDGVDTIDVSRLKTGFVGHSYYADNRTVLSDLFNLINQALPPEDRQCLSQHRSAGKLFWIFDRCAGGE